MKTSGKWIFVIALLCSCAVGVLNSNAGNQRPKGGHNGPPPEAYTACDCKEAGDKAEFVSPHGDTVTGICEKQGDRLVLRPDNPPSRRPGRQE